VEKSNITDRYNTCGQRVGVKIIMLCTKCTFFGPGVRPTVVNIPVVFVTIATTVTMRDGAIHSTPKRLVKHHNEKRRKHFVGLSY